MQATDELVEVDLHRAPGIALNVAARRLATQLLEVVPEIQDLGLDARALRNEPDAVQLLRQDTELLSRSTVALARLDPNVFAEEVTGVRQHAIHRYLQAVLSRYSKVSIEAPVEHGKTTQTDVIRVAWELGRNPGHMVAIVSNSTRIPHRAVAALRTLLRDPKYRQVFPGVALEKETGEELWLTGRKQMHPSVIGIGIEGAIVGSRVSILILDDILDFANTYSEGERRKVFDILTSTVLNRVLMNGRIWDIGTPWHVEDARHRLRRLPGFVHVRFDATDGENVRINGKLLPIAGHKAGDTLWPDRVVDDQGMEYGWPRERLEEKRRSMPKLEFDRQFRCIASSGSLAIFKAQDLDRCLAAGRGWPFPSPALAGEVVVSGVDLAFTKKEVADETVIFTGTCRRVPAGYRLLPLDIRGGHWELRETLNEMRAVVRRFAGHSGFRVESNGAQAYLLQLLNDHDALGGMGWTARDISRLNVTAHVTEAEYKMDPLVGVRSMSADFEQGRWIIPCDMDGVPCDVVQRFVDGLVAFDPLGHTSDYVMAAWMFREQLRRYMGGADDLWALAGVA